MTHEVTLLEYDPPTRSLSRSPFHADDWLVKHADRQQTCTGMSAALSLRTIIFVISLRISFSVGQ